MRQNDKRRGWSFSDEDSRSSGSVRGGWVAFILRFGFFILRFGFFILKFPFFILRFVSINVSAADHAPFISLFC